LRTGCDRHYQIRKIPARLLGVQIKDVDAVYAKAAGLDKAKGVGLNQ